MLNVSRLDVIREIRCGRFLLHTKYNNDIDQSVTEEDIQNWCKVYRAYLEPEQMELPFND